MPNSGDISEPKIGNFQIFYFFILKTKRNNCKFQCYTENMNQMYKCADACQNDMICVNQCFLALAEQNDLCPCGKFCESRVKLY